MWSKSTSGQGGWGAKGGRGVRDAKSLENVVAKSLKIHVDYLIAVQNKNSYIP